MAEVKLNVADQQNVRMIYLGQDIGGGTITGASDQIDIEVEFEWPPDAIAIVQGTFHFKILSDNTCAVEASFPGLLQKDIQDRDASYFVLLIGARPQFNITTHQGDKLVFVSTGPFGDPEKVTGYQLGIAEPGQHGLTFDFETLPG